MLYFHEINPKESQWIQTMDFKNYPYRVSIRREFKTDNSWRMSIVDLNEENAWCKKYCIGNFAFDIVILPENGEGLGRIVSRFTHLSDVVAFQLTFK